MRAIGIVRQSKGSEEALSPAEQRARIADHCEREGLELVEIREEIDVSGGTPLARREGLRGAVEAVEAGDAEVVLVAYFDRLVRSLTVQEEVVSRVEAKGGRVVAIDFGEITGRTAAQWLSGTMIGAVSEYYRRSVRERAGEAQAMAIARGVPTWNNITPGYSRGPDKRLVPNNDADAVREAFRMRAARATIVAIRSYLAGKGIRRSYHGVQSLLTSRVVLGELHFGDLSNLEAHEPIVDRETWRAVQKMRGQRGTRPKSDRLLARLGVLRCGNCGARMVVGIQTQNGRRYPFYRCPPVGDCPRRQTIGAEIAEGFVIDQVKVALAGLQGRASAEQGARDAEAKLEEAQTRLNAAIRAFGEIGDEPAALDRLRELRDARDEAREKVGHLGHLRSALTIGVEDWDRLSLEGRRGLIRATVAEVTVHPGKGVSRLRAKLLV